MADVFISYHENSAGTLAQQIADTLESWGISCWVARRDMPPGGNFANEVPPQIDKCELFLLLLNEQACQSLHIAACPKYSEHFSKRENPAFQTVFRLKRGIQGKLFKNQNFQGKLELQKMFAIVR